MSKLIANLENVAGVLRTAELMVDKIKSESKAAMDPKQYTKENTIKTVKETRAKIDGLATERAKILLSELAEKRARLDHYLKPERTGQEQQHFWRSERIARAKTAEEAAEIYKRNLDRLSKSDQQKHRYIYDDSLYETIAQLEPAAAHLAELAIDPYRSDIERSYIQGVKVQHEIYQQSKVIDTAIEEQLQALEQGKAPVHFNWAQIVNEIRSNALHNVTGPEPLPTFKINPYDTEAEAEPAEAAAE
jgi:hypothetical protein